MGMNKFLSVFFSFILSVVISHQSFAAPKAAFMLADAKTGEILIQEGEVETRRPPWCSFNIALALMGYETGILENTETPEWRFPGDENSLEFEAWKGKIKPATWMKNSVVWYSQALAGQIGIERFKDFLNKFKYGNQDASSDEENVTKNKTPHCWLGSSLKISPAEQLSLVKSLVNKELPLSDKAHRLTKEILYREDLSHGWKLYGKTGYGYQLNPDETRDNKHRIGWFVGWIEKGDKAIVFVSSIWDQNKKDGYTRARESAIDKLTKWIATQ